MNEKIRYLICLFTLFCLSLIVGGCSTKDLCKEDNAIKLSNNYVYEKDSKQIQIQRCNKQEMNEKFNESDLSKYIFLNDKTLLLNLSKYENDAIKSNLTNYKKHQLSEGIYIIDNHQINKVDNPDLEKLILNKKGQVIAHHLKQKNYEIIDYTNMPMIFQRTAKYQKYDCPDNGAYLKEDISSEGCQLINFMLVNNYISGTNESFKQLYQEGYRCHFDYQRASKKRNLVYQFHNLNAKEYTHKLNYKFNNKDEYVNNKNSKFSIKDVLTYNQTPVMMWMVPKNENKLDNGHLVTVLKYEKKNDKENYYFYDSFNQQTPLRDLNEFSTRWKITQLHLIK